MEQFDRKELDTEEQSKSRHYQHFNKYKNRNKRRINKHYGNHETKVPHWDYTSKLDRISEIRFSKNYIKKLFP